MPKLTSETAHTVVILIILLMFAFTAYATNENLGSPSRVFDLLVEASKRHPVEGNAGGSYLMMRSKEGAIFFVISKCARTKCM
jgi:Na+/proline symporter